jgi:YVTN family beta-propeller protein
MSRLGNAVADWAERNRRLLSVASGLLLMLVAGTFMFTDSAVLPAALLGIAAAGFFTSNSRLLGAGWLLGVTPATVLHFPWLNDRVGQAWLFAVPVFGIAMCLAMLAVAGTPGRWFMSGVSREARAIIVTVLGIIISPLSLTGREFWLIPEWPTALIVPALLLLPSVAPVAALLICTRGWLRCAGLTGSAASAVDIAIDLYLQNGSVASTGILILGSTTIVLATLAVFAYRAARECTSSRIPDLALGFAVLVVIGVAVGPLVTTPVVATIPISDYANDGGEAVLAITPNGGRVYLIGSNSVYAIDTASNAVVATIPVAGIIDGAVAIAPDGSRAYVTKVSEVEASASNEGSTHEYTFEVLAIDTLSNVVTATTPLSGRPAGVAAAPDGRHVYVPVNANYSRDGSHPAGIEVIDTVSNAVTSTIPLPDNPMGMAIAPDGRHAYITVTGYSVLVIDIASNAVGATIPLSGVPTALAITGDGGRVYITTFGEQIDPQTYGVLVIDAATNAVVTTIPISNSGEVATVPAGHRAYLATWSPEMLEIDIASNSVTDTIRLSCYSGGFVIAPDERRAYVNCSSSVAVIELGD